MDVIAVRIVGKQNHRNVGHRANVDELLHGIDDVPFVDQEIKSALNGIANGVHDNADGQHLQRAAIPDDAVGVQCPRPVENRFEREHVHPVKAENLECATCDSK